MARILVAMTLLPACLATAWIILRRPFREICEEILFEKARDRFRFQREHLEARFLQRLDLDDLDDKARWEEGHWHDEIVWARDRKTRRLLALIGVRFDPEPFSNDPPRFSTALFEFRQGEWTTEGRCLDELRPAEALLLYNRLEPIIEAPRRTSEPGGTML